MAHKVTINVNAKEKTISKKQNILGELFHRYCNYAHIHYSITKEEQWYQLINIYLCVSICFCYFSQRNEDATKLKELKKKIQKKERTALHLFTLLFVEMNHKPQILKFLLTDLDVLARKNEYFSIYFSLFIPNESFAILVTYFSISAFLNEQDGLTRMNFRII